MCHDLNGFASSLVLVTHYGLSTGRSSLVILVYHSNNIRSLRTISIGDLLEKCNHSTATLRMSFCASPRQMHPRLITEGNHGAFLGI